MDIKDIKPQELIGIDYKKYLIGLIIFVILIVVIYFINKYLQRFLKRREKAVIIKEAPKKAHEIAYEFIDKIEREDLLSKREFKRYYSLISECIKGYIENRFRINAVEMTTREIANTIVDIEIDNKTREMLERLLVKCDMVKFAKFTPELEDAKVAIPIARAVIDNTKEEERVLDIEYTDSPKVEVNDKIIVAKGDISDNN